ncbi:hypothetical protein L226DRAFT_615867 [Lentinus tigrinus ALCF2SS1-7]|uniref:Uncharacterized protein n=1 Tax=Lentinus tigrinus ALCF2SS1-6 TaxID=1328759 RepID=A0A5C2SB91_9APHY|nr:hypothetical protein L227DRAFT_575475 [Lentinus tigrinus ALCF2SS1-6]RPD70932.1 hypothetical protein L226DRAFT_615867 [Lentinus tigrinus ALCF2SS1-7]
MATDPDHLAFFLSETHERKWAYTRHTNPRPEDRRIHRATLVIDSLARLLVDEESGQVFALSILPPSTTQQFTRVIVSANKIVPDQALAHVVYLLESFYHVRQSVRKRRGSDDKFAVPCHIPRDTDDPILSNLVDIEATIYRYSWAKMRRRLTKYASNVAFEQICDAVMAPDDANRQALSQALEDGELQLQNPILQEDVGLLRKLIAKLDKQLAGPPSSDEAVHDVRWTLAALASVVESLPKESNLFGAFSTIQTRVLRGERVDFAHWMDKVLSTHKDFRQLVKIASSRTLEDILTRTVLASKTTPSPLPAQVSITADTLRRALGSAEVSEEILNGFLANKFYYKNGQTVDIDGRIHCECAVLVELDKQWRAGEAIIPFIGMSKLSCSLCSYYFDAYREVTPQNIRTRGSRDEMVPWRCPTLEDEIDDEAVREKLCVRLKTLLFDKVQAYEARRTTASDDGYLPGDKMSREKIDAGLRSRGCVSCPVVSQG